MWQNTLWNFICFLLFYQTFSELMTSRNKVIYETKYDKMENNNHLSICIEIDSKKFDCSSLESFNLTLKEEKIEICNKIKTYFEFIENDERKSPSHILKKCSDLKLPSLFEFNLNSTELPPYLNNKHICFLFKLNIDLEGINSFNKSFNFNQIKVFNKYHLTSNYFIHDRRLPRYVLFTI